MAEEPSGAMHKDLQTLFSAGRPGDLTDGQLLERFVDQRDALAFERLVERHGAMVLRVCRAILNDSHDAQDAFQATFLVLVKKAQSIRRRDSIASWLFGVAGRSSRRAKVTATRRRSRELRNAVEEAGPVTRHCDPDLAPLLHEELRRLPETYRIPVVLCYLEGRTYEEA
ncbi:RNA polymerase sigma factor, partial [Singulisphaera rosea]